MLVRMLSTRRLVLVLVCCCVWTRLVAQTVPSPQPAGPPVPPAVTTTPVGPTESVTPLLPVKAQRPSLMIKKGGKELEWRTSYAHSSRNAIFIDGIAVFPILVIGQVGVQRIRKDSISSSLAGRYGIANNLLGELKVPLRYESDTYSVPEVTPAQEQNVTSFGIGDIEGSLNYQFPRAREDQIRWVMSLGVKSRTGKDPFEVNLHEDAPLGSGFWSSRLGLTGVKIVDPAAVYWSVGYTINLQRRNVPIIVTDLQTGQPTTIYVDIKPANLIEAGGGFAYAINPRLSVNTGVTICWSGATKSQGINVPNSAFTTATLRLGAVWLTDKRQPIDLGLNIGLTDDSPDFSVEYRQSFK